jgi:hypothetical protein
VTLPVLPRPVAMIGASFKALLMTAIGTAVVVADVPGCGRVRYSNAARGHSPDKSKTPHCIFGNALPKNNFAQMNRFASMVIALPRAIAFQNRSSSR